MDNYLNALMPVSARPAIHDHVTLSLDERLARLVEMCPLPALLRLRQHVLAELLPPGNDNPGGRLAA